MATILITHDLALAAERSGRIAVMHAGHIVEDAPTADAARRAAPPLYARACWRRRRPRRATSPICAPSPAACPTCGGTTCRPAASPPAATARLPDCDAPLVWRDLAPAPPRRLLESRMSGMIGNPPTPRAAEGRTLLDVAELSKRFPLGRRALFGGAAPSMVHAVDDVSFTLARGETLGLVGESGCGKSTLVRLITRLTDPTTGSIRFGTRRTRGAAGQASSPATRTARASRSSSRMPARASTRASPPPMPSPTRCASCCGLSRRGAARRRSRRPRRCAACRWSCWTASRTSSPAASAPASASRAPSAPRPDLLVLDEPTAALDVSVQVTILQLLVTLRETLGISYVFVSHDLNVVRLLCDRVVVMYLGRIVEVGPARAVFDAPLHPYTRGLVAAVPRLDGARADALRLAGDPRSPIDPDPNACRFHGRCPVGTDRCGVEMPALRRFAGGREAACHYAVAD